MYAGFPPRLTHGSLQKKGGSLVNNGGNSKAVVMSKKTWVWQGPSNHLNFYSEKAKTELVEDQMYWLGEN